MNTEQAEALLGWEDLEEFKEVESNIVGTTRWHTWFEVIFQNTQDETFWRINYARGSTEYQDEGPEMVSICQVKPVPVTTIKYIPVNE